MSAIAQPRPRRFARWALFLVIVCVVVAAASYLTYGFLYTAHGDNSTAESSAIMRLCLNAISACVPVLLISAVLAAVSFFKEGPNARAVLALIVAALTLVLVGPIFVFWALPHLGFSF